MMDWAKEAWDDLNRVVIDPDPASRSGDSIRVIGHSPTNEQQPSFGRKAMKKTYDAEHERNIDKEVARIQKLSESKEFRDAVDFSNAKRATNTSVMSVRMNDFEIEEINAKAKESGIPTSVLLRSWILQGLRAEKEDSLMANFAELELSVNRLRRRLFAENNGGDMAQPATRAKKKNPRAKP